MKTCPVCDGEGVCAYEEAVVDYEHGGYLQEVYGECDMCYGSGEVDDEEEEQLPRFESQATSLRWPRWCESVCFTLARRL